MSFCHHIPGVKCQNCMHTYTQDEMSSPMPLPDMILRKDYEAALVKIDKLKRIASALRCFREGTTNYERAIRELDEM